jgi:hypothetical protein
VNAIGEMIRIAKTHDQVPTADSWPSCRDKLIACRDKWYRRKLVMWRDENYSCRSYNATKWPLSKKYIMNITTPYPLPEQEKEFLKKGGRIRQMMNGDVWFTVFSANGTLVGKMDRDQFEESCAQKQVGKEMKKSNSAGKLLCGA